MDGSIEDGINNSEIFEVSGGHCKDYSGMLDDYEAKADEIIKRAEEDLSALNKFLWTPKYSSLILAGAVLINLGLMLYFSNDYFIYWIMCSFVFLMTNPFLLILPTDFKDLRKIKDYAVNLSVFERKEMEEEKALLKDKKEKEAIISKEKIKAVSRRRKYLYEFVWNIFFINCQPLAPGIFLLFALSSVFAFAGWLISGFFGLLPSLVVIIQSLAIIVFYAAIVRVKPYSSGFFSKMTGISSGFKEMYGKDKISGLKFLLAAAVLISVAGILFIAAILLPGFTYTSFMSAEGDIQIRAVSFLIVFISQMIFVRYLQGLYSRRLVESFLNSVIFNTKNSIIPAIAQLKAEQPGSESLDCKAESDISDEFNQRLFALNMEIFKIRAVRIDYRSLFGFFPVCMVNPNASVIPEVFDRAEEKV
ncbi:MAG: hypothetical protein PHP13_05370 [Methanomicrobium sp.]|nr:hypothetical protein [Methanomicrobium sp.]